MFRYRRMVSTLLLACLLAAPQAAAGERHEKRYIVLASTTSTENSGLFRAIIPPFTEATGISVRVVAVGTGQAFAIARRGDADALLVHDPSGEAQLIAEGHASERAEIMVNDFVIIGPAEDPARITAAETAIEAFAAIAATESTFASRGDDSGTHRAERQLWRAAGIAPQGTWYRALGSGMGPTLNTAAAMDAYVFTDRATWAAFDNRQDLALLFEGDEALLNPYASVLLSTERHPHLKHAPASKWHRWLLSEEGQQAIGDFEIAGQAVFMPSARSDSDDALAPSDPESRAEFLVCH
ncbi:substrate-binding domain-containing protein [Halomonas sp. BC04]|uniref:substrate-binding domain-containing protein n=1 Tax=Halomonas sp. BC04 TaxID=1403540 RepID=UPI0003ED679A|nr:substrate-binding domain-containing protein [Halomonas sp. BC04]EWG99724.1 tungsten ABC transporter substrate-binding protein [Halomonas sp. BC04]